MKKCRLAILFLTVIMLFLLVGCEFEDGMIVIDFVGQNPSESQEHNQENTKGDGYTSQTESKAESPDESSVNSCDHEKTEYIVISEANCTEVGYTQLVCTDCYQPLGEAEEIAPKGHYEGIWQVEKEATVTEEGIKYTFCLVCNEKLTDIIAPLGYSEGLEFKSNGDGTCSVIGIGQCKDTVIYIPPVSPDGDTVVAIGDSAFSYCDFLVEIVIPETVTDIGEMAFAHCIGIKALDIPASVETIGEGVISAKDIEQITVARDNLNFKVVNNCLVGKDGLLIVGYGECSIPSGVSIIGNGAFAGNAYISSIIIPSGVKEIREYAFSDSSVIEITIPYGVTSIGDMAFLLCEGLEKVTLYSSVDNIGSLAFDECPKLSEIIYYGTLEEWNSINIDEDNARLLSAPLTVIGGVSPETVYGYGRTTISGNAAILYDLLEASIMADEPIGKIKIDVSEKITLEDFYTARAIFMSDHPECFWWDGVISYTATQQEGYINSMEFEYTYSGEALLSMRALLEERVNEILSGLPDGSVFDKMLYLHDEVAKSVVYERTPNDQTPYGALVEGRAVCNGYATAYQMLLQRAGIRAWTVNGYANGEAHAWNVVWLDNGVCVYTDVTWNDSENFISHYYFNMSYGEISEEHFTNEEFDLPECKHSEYGYYDLSPDANTLLQKDSASKLDSFLEEGEDGSLTAIFLFNGYSFDEWLDVNGGDLAEKLGSFSVEYYTIGYEIFVIFTK